MNIILAVIKKELRYTLRDKRTLISSILLPAILFPLLCFGLFKLQAHLINKDRKKELKIAFVEIPETMKAHFKDDTFKSCYNLNLETAKKAVSTDSIDAIIEFSTDFTANVNQLKSGTLTVYYKSTNRSIYNRVLEKIDVLKSQLLNTRTKQLNMSTEVFTPIVISQVNIASKKEEIGTLFGGFLPYFFILFCFFWLHVSGVRSDNRRKRKWNNGNAFNCSGFSFRNSIRQNDKYFADRIISSINHYIGLRSRFEIFTQYP